MPESVVQNFDGEKKIHFEKNNKMLIFYTVCKGACLVTQDLQSFGNLDNN